MSEFEEALELLVARFVDLTSRDHMVEALRNAADALETDEDEDESV